MAGLNGLVKSFKSDANIRAFKYTVFVKSGALTSTQRDYFASLPAGVNAAGILGVLVEHFHEDNYFIRQPVGTAGAGTYYPENITGTTPGSGWDLTYKPLSLLIDGEGYAIAGVAAVPQGDPLIIADAYGRVYGLSNWIAATSPKPGDTYYALGYAQHGTSNLDDYILCTVRPFTGKV